MPYIIFVSNVEPIVFYIIFHKPPPPSGNNACCLWEASPQVSQKGNIQCCGAQYWRFRATTSRLERQSWQVLRLWNYDCFAKYFVMFDFLGYGQKKRGRPTSKPSWSLSQTVVMHSQSVFQTMWASPAYGISLFVLAFYKSGDRIQVLWTPKQQHWNQYGSHVLRSLFLRHSSCRKVGYCLFVLCLFKNICMYVCIYFWIIITSGSPSLLQIWETASHDPHWWGWNGESPFGACREDRSLNRHIIWGKRDLFKKEIILVFTPKFSNQT